MCVLCWSKLTYSLAGIQISSVDRIECYAGLRWIIYAISVEEIEKDGKNVFKIGIEFMQRSAS